MKFALHFANITMPDPSDAKRLAIAAERAGFESLITIEHVAWPVSYASSYPYSESGRLPWQANTPLPDPLIWMAYVAAATKTLRLITGVLILPQRNPLVTAKEVATLDHMSEGRISLGIGVGWLREEFQALGVPFEGRGARADEYLAAMRVLWSDDPASFHGRFVSFDQICCNPKPVRGSVPIIVGGHSKAAVRRAGRLADGFFPATGSRGDVMPLIKEARRFAADAGRDPDALEITMGCPNALPGSKMDPIAAVEERRAKGVSRIALPVASFLPDLEASLARFGEQVIAQTS